MKVGDTVPVLIAGQTVAAAKITHMEEGKATLVVPGTVVVMATRTQIDAPEPVEPEKETIVTGVERTSNDTSATTSEGATSEQPAVSSEVAEPDAQPQAKEKEPVSEVPGPEADSRATPSEAGTSE